MFQKHTTIVVSLVLMLVVSPSQASDGIPRPCCLPDGSCVDMLKEACPVQGGYSGGLSNVCSAFICGCPDLFDGCEAACCFPDAACYDSSPRHCLELGGTPQAKGTSCLSMVCECTTPVDECAFVACCMPDGSCSDLPKDQCLLRGGANGGPGTACGADFVCGCPDRQDGCTVACCEDQNVCQDWSPSYCKILGGVPQPEGTTCRTFDCESRDLACRVTGGGVDTFGNWNGTMAEGSAKKGTNANDVDRYTFGGQAGAPVAGQPQPYGEWTHHQQRGPDGSFLFHAGTASAPDETEVSLIVCSDPGWCVQARPAPAKQIDFEGVGQFKNIKNPPAVLSGVVAGETFHFFEVHIEDLGEPGRSGKQDPPASTCPTTGSAGALADCDCPDFYHIRIHATSDPSSAVVYEVYSYITGGNLQIHPTTPHG